MSDANNLVETGAPFNKLTHSPYTPEDLNDPDKWADWMLKYENPSSGGKYTPEETLEWISGIADKTEKTIAIAKRIPGMSWEQTEEYVKKSVEATNYIKRLHTLTEEKPEKYYPLIPGHPKQVEAARVARAPVAGKR